MTQEPASSSKTQTPSSPTSASVQPTQGGHVSRSSTSFVARSQGVIARLGTLFTRRSMSSTRPEEALETAPSIVPAAPPSVHNAGPSDPTTLSKQRRRTTKMHVAPQLDLVIPEQQQQQQMPTRKQGSLPALQHEPRKVAELSEATQVSVDLTRRPSVRRVQVQPLAPAASASRSVAATPVDEPAEPSPSLASPPYSWRHTLKHLSAELSEFEKLEVTRYQEVFFVSSAAVKRRRHRGKILPPEAVADADASFASSGNSSNVELHNDGFDDERGDYLMVAGDHLAYRYEVLHPLGAGSFGQVVACRDHKLQRVVAVKVIRNRKKYKEQALVEIQVLLHLRTPLPRGTQLTAGALLGSPNAGGHVVELLEYFEFRHHLCLTFELLGVNLYDYLKLRFFQGMPPANLRVVATQLLQALASLRLRHVIHCDLKPENVLIRAPLPQFAAGPNGASAATAHEPVASVCLIDFGSSCLAHATMYTYIQSRFYRSPEVILGHVYDMAIDMWSFGCILVELHTGHPIFAGENEREQLMCMLEVLGVPPATFLLQCKRRKHFFEEEASQSESVVATFRPIPFTNSRGRKRLPGTRPLEPAIKSDDAEFVALVRKCFAWEPSERLTPEQALREPWIASR
ncbi:hypothetical protein ATCC90586_003788 [Pythium insidiosum]|nr:hypothetical protein ATCC90586_003788 [Pythium insidiosum]